MTWEAALAMGIPIIKAVVEAIAAAVGESTATVRARVLAELAKPDTDPTDTEAAAIDQTWPTEPDQ